MREVGGGKDSGERRKGQARPVDYLGSGGFHFHPYAMPCQNKFLFSRPSSFARDVPNYELSAPQPPAMATSLPALTDRRRNPNAPSAVALPALLASYPVHPVHPATALPQSRACILRQSILASCPPQRVLCYSSTP